MRCSPLLALLLAPLASDQTTWYVDDDGTAPGSGTQTDPYTSVSYAPAQPATLTGDTVLVADGTYLDERLDYGGKDVSVVSENGALATTLVAPAPSPFPSTIALFVAGEGPGARLEGFTLTGGTGELGTYQSANMEAYGGAVLCVGTSPTLVDLRITACQDVQYGGGVFLKDSSTSLTDCEVWLTADTADFIRGGGVTSVDGDVQLLRVTVRDCGTNLFGGGLWLAGGRASLEDCVIRDNSTSSGFGAGIYALGVALELRQTRVEDNFGDASGAGLYAQSCGTLVEDCLFEDNRAGAEPYSGAAIYATGGQLQVERTDFRGNVGQFGGAVWTNNAAVIEDCLFDSNRSTGSGQYDCSGGALWAQAGAVVRRSVFWGNTSDDTYTDGGGAVFGGVRLERCTLVGNRTVNGKGGGARFAELEDCIVWGNTGDTLPFQVDSLADATANFCLVEGGWSGTANLDEDPRFWDQGLGDLRLLPGSPAIDAGRPSGSPDPDGTAPDMGAFPFDPTYCGTGCDGPLGTPYCTATANSTGQSALLSGLGTTDLSGNLVLLTVESLPVGRPGYFLMSETQAFVPLFSGSQGNLCLGSPLVRLTDQVLFANTAGRVARQVDVTSLPQGAVFLPGSAWNFQYWTRDVNPGSTSNTSQGLVVTWQ